MCGTGARESACTARSHGWGAGARESDCTVKPYVCGGLGLGRVTVQ